MEGLTYWCWIKHADLDEPCQHRRCLEDPLRRCDYDSLMNAAATCTNHDLARHAEMTLRKRYPSSVKIKRGPFPVESEILPPR